MNMKRQVKMKLDKNATKVVDRRVSLMSVNKEKREIDISTSNSKFDVEILKNEVMNVVRKKNAVRVVESKNPYGFQLKYKYYERRVSRLSKNREIDISTSNSKFDVENLKREVVKAGRDKNFIVPVSKNPYGFQLKYKSSEQRVPLLSQNVEITISASNPKFGVENVKTKAKITLKKIGEERTFPFIPRFGFQTCNKWVRSKVEIIAQQVSWNCNKQLVFNKLSETTAKIEKDIICRRKIKLDKQKSSSLKLDVTSVQSGVGTSTTPTPTSITDSMGQSPSASRATASETREGQSSITSRVAAADLKGCPETHVVNMRQRLQRLSVLLDYDSGKLSSSTQHAMSTPHVQSSSTPPATAIDLRGCLENHVVNTQQRLQRLSVLLDPDNYNPILSNSRATAAATVNRGNTEHSDTRQQESNLPVGLVTKAEQVTKVGNLAITSTFMPRPRTPESLPSDLN